ncbi:hypothetical protein Q0Z83_022550 [Actinoplanes sichuanensis]|uniref:Protease complex subunit PrcB family protein n=1 Tax=Actinoplanes sichuanensis TaxID=512349 RepID=A0ABW4AJS5_9ACTN|nr:protease complex subunit PrcB family protein [Actinoplanes sichuanensis]BEL04064.1 hypothetical protein Q0Z83_022550 [Actinoplanes sichuanensis]
MVEPISRVLLPFRTVDISLPRDLSEGLHVVRGEDDWAGPPNDRAAVDWQTEMCIVFALGSRPSGGYSALIQWIMADSERVHVVAWEIRPGNCAATRNVTHPFQTVAVPVHPGPVELIKRIADEDCEAAR